MTPLPATAIVAAEALPRRRRRVSTQVRLARASVPYLLILPVVASIGAVLGYPLYILAKISFQKYGLFELIRHHGTYIGLANFRSIYHDPVFWHSLVRTIIFTVANVALTMVLGTLIALLLTRISAVIRVVLTIGLMVVWSMPIVVAVQVWYYITNFENGVLNYGLTQLGVGDFFHHDWYASPFSQLAMTTSLIVWGAIPFIVITVYAGLSQVPHDLVEAAEVDGARPWRIFLDVTVPILKPIFLILTSLSIIWDFGVFTQPYLLIGREHIDTSNFLTGIYLYQEGYATSDYGRGAAISVVMLLIVAILSIFYVRKMVRMDSVE